jgi:hypothetical protein
LPRLHLEYNIGKFLHSNDYEEFERIYFHPSLYNFNDTVLVLVDIYETRAKLDEQSDISPMMITKNLYEIEYFDQSDALKKVKISRIFSFERLRNVFRFNYTRYYPPLLGGGAFTLYTKVGPDESDADENEESDPQDIVKSEEGSFHSG